MLNKFARAFVTRLITPIARLLLELGLSPDMVTVIGTIGVCSSALFFYSHGQFVWGTVAITFFVISDLLDGTMARVSGRSSNWGAFLDSTLDRFGDACVFGGLVLYYTRQPDGAATAWCALACLVFGFVTSYARARAEGLGFDGANVGIAERADRLVVVLGSTFLVGLFGWPDLVLTIILGLLALASAFTVAQRMLSVKAEMAQPPLTDMSESASAGSPAEATSGSTSSAGSVGSAGSGGTQDHRPPLAERLTVTGFVLAWRLVCLLPERLAALCFTLAADMTYRRNGTDVRRMRANYARVRPELGATELDALVRCGVRSYLRYWREVFRLPRRSWTSIERGVRVVGDGPVRAALAEGRPVVCFLGHMGNRDTAGAWATRELAPVITVAERLRPEELYRRFLAFREGLGMTILPLTGGGDVFAQLQELARDRACIVPLLADRDLSDTGVDVRLVRRTARMAAGPAALALAIRAPLHPVTLHYERSRRGPAGYRLVITFHRGVPVPPEGTGREKAAAMTQACADALGLALGRHTEDWHMMQRVFVEDTHDDAGGG